MSENKKHQGNYEAPLPCPPRIKIWSSSTIP